ncbi:mucin-2-like [Oppia nitens]|uniref:mucin-2-like n=1 Tax=Oppia nitens TaxID=1686743 RepID=UPI0023DB2D8D|nr:mucin-2-like [Oppia nitens]
MDPRKPMYRLPDFTRRPASERQPTPFAPMRPIVMRPILPEGAEHYFRPPTTRGMRPLGEVRQQSSRLPTPTLRRTQSLPTGLSRMGSDEPFSSDWPSPPGSPTPRRSPTGSPTRRFISTPFKPSESAPRRALRPLTFMEQTIDSESTSEDEDNNKSLIGRPVSPKRSSSSSSFDVELGSIDNRAPSPSWSSPSGSRQASPQRSSSRSPPRDAPQQSHSEPTQPTRRRPLRPLTFMEPRLDLDSESTSEDEDNNNSLIGRPVPPKYSSSSSSIDEKRESFSNSMPSPPDSLNYISSSSEGSLTPSSSLTSLTSRSSYSPSNSFGSYNSSSSGRSLTPSSNSSSLTSVTSLSGLSSIRSTPTTSRSRSRISSNTSIQRIEPIPDMSSFDRINQFESSNRRSYPMPDALPRDRGYYAGRQFESTESRQSPFSPSGQSSRSSRAGGFGNTLRRFGSAIRSPFRRRRGTYDINSDSQQHQKRMSYLNEEEEEGSPKGNVPLCGCGHTYNDCKCRLI